MGLDIVEVVMRCEEIFDVRLEPIRLEQMRTVGDLFELICEQLNLPCGATMRDPNSWCHPPSHCHSRRRLVQRQCLDKAGSDLRGSTPGGSRPSKIRSQFCR
jgi:hypothetical protein